MLESLSIIPRMPVRSRAILAGIVAAVAVAILLTGYGFGVNRICLAEVDLPTNGVAPPPTIRQESPVLRVHLRGFALTGLQVKVDDREVPGEVSWLTRTLTARAGPLAQGRHRLSLRQGDRDQTWPFVVDTLPPAIRVTSPRPGAQVSGRYLALQGQAEPGARVQALLGRAQVQGRPGPDGTFNLRLPLEHGRGTLRWQASDAAGNVTTGRLDLNCDQTPPTLQASWPEAPPEGPAGILLKTSSPRLRLLPADPETGIRSIRVRVDGGKARGIAPDDRGRPVEDRLQGLPEGLRKVEVTVLNGAGAATVEELEVVVDSTEQFGQATLTLGARGRDVEELQRRLAARGYLRQADAAGQFGEPTRQGLMAMQRDAGLKPDGIAGPYTIGALSSQIYVNLARFSLVLVEWDGSTRSYMVAHGTPEFPTPTGSFFVADLARNPSWIPPDSPWAREAEVAPPGPGNPLGTRWIGLNHGGVGIHGTPADWTIGSRASHGCLRMTIPDVEDLFEHVDLGTRVRILEGTEDDPILSELWP